MTDRPKDRPSERQSCSLENYTSNYKNDDNNNNMIIVMKTLFQIAILFSLQTEDGNRTVEQDRQPHQV